MDANFFDEMLRISAKVSQQRRASQEQAAAEQTARLKSAFIKFWSGDTPLDCERGLVEYGRARGFLPEKATYTADDVDSASVAFMELVSDDTFAAFDFEDKRLWKNRFSHLKKMRLMLEAKEEAA